MTTGKQSMLRACTSQAKNITKKIRKGKIKNKRNSKYLSSCAKLDYCTKNILILLQNYSFLYWKNFTIL